MGILNDRNKIEIETAKMLIDLCLLVYSSSLQPSYAEHDCLQGVWKMESTLLQNEILLMILYTLFMPLCMLGYMFTAPNRLTKKMETSLCKLLALVAMSAFQDKYDSFLRLSPLSEFEYKSML